MNFLPFAAPESVGIDSQGLIELLNNIEEKKLNINSFIIVKNAQVIAEAYYAPYNKDYRHMLYSLSKSFTSIATGFAVGEGLLSTEDLVVSFFKEQLPSAPCENMQKMKIKHLLNMCTGHTQEPGVPPCEDSLIPFLTSYVEKEPGSRFLYNTAASNVMSFILQKVTGVTTEEYLRPRLFEPLGFEDYIWETDPNGVTFGGYGLNLRTRDIAKFGQFLLNKGMWNGKQLLNPQWIETASSSLIIQPPGGSGGWTSGYGYQFWRCHRENAYRGDGAFGQLCVVIEEKDMVIAATAGLSDIQLELDTFFDFTEKYVHPAPLPEHHKLHNAFLVQCSRLAIPTPQGDRTNPRAALAKERIYELSNNIMGLKKIEIKFRDETEMILHREEGVSHCAIGYRKWKVSDTTQAADKILTDRFNFCPKIACSAAWVKDNYVIKMVGVNTPYISVMTIEFKGNGIIIQYTCNVAFYDDVKEQIILGIS